MRSYFIKRTTDLIGYLAVISFVGAIGVTMGFPDILFCMAIGLVGLLFSQQPTWYLLLPYSRKKLIGYHLIQVLFNCSLCLLAIYIVNMNVEVKTKSDATMLMINSMLAIFPILSTFAPVTFKANVESKFKKTQLIKKIPVLAICLFVFIGMDRLKQIPPVFLFLFVIFAAANWIYAPAASMILPRESLKRFKISIICVAALLSMLLTGGSAYLTKYGEPSSIFTQFAKALTGSVKLEDSK